MMETLMELIAKIFIGSWFVSVILHIGAGLRYGCLRMFRRGKKVSYRQIRYGSEDFKNITMPTTTLPTDFSASSFSQQF